MFLFPSLLFLFCFVSFSQPKIGSKRSEIQDTGGRVTWNALDSEGCGRSAIGRSTLEKEVDEKSSQDTYLNSGEDINESDWEEGSIPTLDSVDNHQNAGIKEVTIELSGLLDSSQQKPIRRASAEDKVNYVSLSNDVFIICLTVTFALMPKRFKSLIFPSGIG